MSYNLANKYFNRLETNILNYYKNILGNMYEESVSKDFFRLFLDAKYRLDISYLKTAMSIKNYIDITSKELRDSKQEELVLHNTKIDYAYIALEHLYNIDKIVNTCVLNILKMFKSEELKVLKTEIQKQIFKELKDKEDKIENIVKEIYSTKEKGYTELGESFRESKEEFLEEFKNKICEDIYDRVDLLKDMYLIDNFYIKTKNLKKIIKENENGNEKLEIRILDLKYNIEFPLIYSSNAIEEVYNNDEIINENRNLILYYLATHEIILDLMNEDINKEYILDFPESIKEKEQKRKTLTNIISSEYVKEKCIMCLSYDFFNNNEKYLFPLIKEGYKFCVKIEDVYNIDLKDIQRFELLKYIIIDGEELKEEEVNEYKRMLKDNNYTEENIFVI